MQNNDRHTTATWYPSISTPERHKSSQLHAGEPISLACYKDISTAGS